MDPARLLVALVLTTTDNAVIRGSDHPARDSGQVRDAMIRCPLLLTANLSAHSWCQWRLKYPSQFAHKVEVESS